MTVRYTYSVGEDGKTFICWTASMLQTFLYEIIMRTPNLVLDIFNLTLHYCFG